MSKTKGTVALLAIIAVAAIAACAGFQFSTDNAIDALTVYKQGERIVDNWSEWDDAKRVVETDLFIGDLQALVDGLPEGADRDRAPSYSTAPGSL